MIRFVKTLTVLALLLLAFHASPILGQDEQTEKGEPAMDPAMAEMMEVWMKYAEPGEHHSYLDPLAGSWQLASKFRMSADGPWSESSAEADSRWVLGNRFLLQEVKGEAMMGMPPFEGLGLLGYDNYKEKYVGTWCDNMGTLIMMMEGTCDESGKVITLVGTYPDPATKKDKTSKWVYRILGPDKFVMEMHEPGPDGKEFQMAEITYTRRARN